MFSFLLQDLLVWLAEVSHQISPLVPRYQNLALQSRLQLQQIYHMPEPITVGSTLNFTWKARPNNVMQIAATLRTLQDDIRFARRNNVIRQTIVGTF